MRLKAGEQVGTASPDSSQILLLSAWCLLFRTNASSSGHVLRISAASRGGNSGLRRLCIRGTRRHEGGKSVTFGAKTVFGVRAVSPRRFWP